MHYLLHDFKIDIQFGHILFKWKPIQQQENCFGCFPSLRKLIILWPILKKNCNRYKIRQVPSKLHSCYIQKTLKKMLVAIPFYICLPMHLGDTETCCNKIYDQEIYIPSCTLLNINPDLVVLSACETGIGNYINQKVLWAQRISIAGAKLVILLWKRLYNRFIYGQILYLHIITATPI
jgi:hypothetical protein